MRPIGARDSSPISPLFSYPWAETEKALHRLAEIEADPFDDIAFDYTNPTTGGHVLPTIGCRIQMLRPGIHTRAHRHSYSSVYHVFRGRGATIVDGIKIDWEQGDFFVLPPNCWHEHLNPSAENAVLFSTTDAPVLELLQLDREEEYSEHGGHQKVETGYAERLRIRSLGNVTVIRDAKTPASELSLGIAGLGVASTMVLPGVEKFPHARIAAAADLRPNALDAFRQAYDARTYDNVEALCADPDLDVIWIATPNQFHCDHTIMAAEHGKHVICTKPMALTIEECGRMCDAADRNGVKLLCGQTYSMSPDIQALWREARSGKLGRLVAINTWLSTDWLLKPRVAEELDEALGGGVVHRHAPI